LAMETLNRQFDIVNSSVQAQYRLEEDSERQFRENIEATLWAGYPSSAENEMDQTIAKLVVIIENVCVPVLRLES